MQIFRIVLMGVVLLLCVYVALSPKVVYAPVPRVVLFFLCSALLAILFGTEAASRLELELPGFTFVTAGAAALSLGTLWFLTKLAKPEEKIAVFHVVDEKGQKVSLEHANAYEVLLSGSGLRVATFASGNTLVCIFPEQVGEVELQVNKTTGRTFSGMIGFAGVRQRKLVLGKDLKSQGAA
jgi:hypothetical protein